MSRVPVTCQYEVRRVAADDGSKPTTATLSFPATAEVTKNGTASAPSFTASEARAMGTVVDFEGAAIRFAP